jgi:hypothetical protein
MWNWKSIFEDGEVAIYWDIDNVIDPEADEDGLYSSVECYRAMPSKAATWISISAKGKDGVSRYIAQRKESGLNISGYKKYRYTLCLAEVDAEKGTYRVIPAIDYTSDDKQLGTSSLLSEGGAPLVKGIKTDWSPIRSRNTHKAIRALYKVLFPPAKAEDE